LSRVKSLDGPRVREISPVGWDVNGIARAMINAEDVDTVVLHFNN